jgi:hypothetical protein
LPANGSLAGAAERQQTLTNARPVKVTPPALLLLRFATKGNWLQVMFGARQRAN